MWRCFHFLFGRLNDLVPLKKFYPEVISLATLQMNPSAFMWIQSMNCNELHKTWATWFYKSSLSCGDKSSNLRGQIKKLREQGGQRIKCKQSNEVSTGHCHEAFCKNSAFFPLYLCPLNYNPNSVSTATTETWILVLASIVENYQILFCMQSVS